MRRKDREMDKDFSYYVIDSSDFGSLSVVDTNNNIYNIPLSIVRSQDRLYFHSAKAGKKVDIFSSNPRVCISFVTDINIPENYSKDELEGFKLDKSKAKDLISNVFTTEFASALAYGKINLVEDEEVKVKAMELICQKYTPTKMEYFQLAIEAGLSRVNVYSVKIDKLTSKRKKYDTNGIEMKWMRMD